MQTSAKPDSVAQKGLSTQEKELGLFLSCQQQMHHDFEIFQNIVGRFQTKGEIVAQKKLNESVVLIEIKLETPFPYRAGQFINLIREDGLSRPYSIANKSGLPHLMLHIKRMAGGLMSEWIFNNDLRGQMLTIQGPAGKCYLTEETQNKNLLLVATGTGLAPLYGIIQECYEMNFDGKIKLFHAGLDPDALYLVEELKNLESRYNHFSYYPLYLKGEKKEGHYQGDIFETMKDLEIEPHKTTAIVCGDPLMVNKLKQTIFLKGVPSQHILSDAFLPSKKT